MIAMLVGLIVLALLVVWDIAYERGVRRGVEAHAQATRQVLALRLECINALRSKATSLDVAWLKDAPDERNRWN